MTEPTEAELFKALKDLIVEAQAVADDHHRPRYKRLDQALASARNAMLDYWAATPQPTQAREIEGLRKDAERYRTFIDCGQPICFMGYEYFGKEALDAAIDAAKGGQHGAE